MRAVGLDVGEKTIGVAVSDALGLAAHPDRTLQRRSVARDCEAILALCAEREADAIVVGLPLTLAGDVGPAARRSLAIADALRARFAGEVATWDERFSTVAAERVLLEADLSRSKRKRVIDAQAAAFMLQGWLDHRAGPAEEAP